MNWGMGEDQKNEKVKCKMQNAKCAKQNANDRTILSIASPERIVH
jgi:hypothetical protein